MEENIEGKIFHILNRGIEKGKIFFEDNDYLRFVYGLYRFNNKDGAIRMTKRKNDFFINIPPQDKLVNILKWTLLPNHYHLLVEERIEGGAVEFTKRIGNGHTKYINIKHKRSGYLFQNSAKIMPVEKYSHFLYIPFYIDLNVIDLIFPNWKESGVKNCDKALKFMLSYRWSSYRDYFGKKNFPDIINKELFYKIFDTNSKEYQEELKVFMSHSDVNL